MTPPALLCCVRRCLCTTLRRFASVRSPPPMSPRPTGSGPVGSGARPIRVASGLRRPWTRPTRPLDSWPSARTMPSWASRSLRWAPGATPATTLGSTRLTWTCRSRPRTACSISPVCGRTGKTVGSGPPSTSAGLSGLPIGASPACSASRGTGPPPSAAACCSKSTISRGLPPSSATTPGRTVVLTVPPVAAPARAGGAPGRVAGLSVRSGGRAGGGGHPRENAPF